MSLRKTFVAFVAGVTVAAIPALSQEDVSYRSDATVQALGSFVKSTTNKGVEQGATK
jgi:hypothetical protein